MRETPSAAPSRSDAIASRFPFQLVGLGILFYGTGPVLARSAETTGVLISFWRLWFGFAAFCFALLVHRLSGRTFGSARGFRLALLAGGVFSINQVTFFTAVKRTSVVDVSLLGTLSPVLVALLAIPLFGERPAARFRWWSLVSMVGAAYVVLGSSTGAEGDPVGMMLALLATGAFAVFFVLSKLARDEVPIVVFLTTVMGTAGLFVSAFVFAFGHDPSSVGATDLWRAVGMALVPGALGHIAMTWPLNYLPANVPPLFRLATPAVAGFLAWIFLGEGFTRVHVIGGAIIVAGLAGAILSKAGQDLMAEARDARSDANPAPTH